MRSRLRFATAVSVGLMGAGVANLARAQTTYNNGNLTIRQVAIQGQLVQANSSLHYTPSSNGSSTSAAIGSTEVFSTFGQPSINSAGNTAFTTVDAGANNISSGNYINLNALFSEGSGSLAMIAHAASYAPDRLGNVGVSTSTTGVFSNFTGLITSEVPNLNANGAITVDTQQKANATTGTITSYASPDNTGSSPIQIGFTSPANDNNALYSSATANGFLALASRPLDAVPAGGSAVPATILLNNVNTVYNNTFAVSALGTIATVVTTADSTDGVATITNGVLTFVARGSVGTITGTTAPFTVPDASGNAVSGVTFNQAGFAGTVVVPINASNQVAFLATLQGTGINTTASSTSPAHDQSNFALFSQGGGTLHQVAQGGLQAPGLTSGDVYKQMGTPDINNAGQVAFTSSLVKSVVTSGGDVISGGSNISNTSAIFLQNPNGSTYVLARTGLQGVTSTTGTQLSPTWLGTGAYFSSFSAPAIDHNGVVADLANIAGTVGGTTYSSANNNSTAIFTTTPTSTTMNLIVQAGQVAPGTGGALFKAITGFSINGLDKIAFYATLQDGTGNLALNTSGTFYGYYAQDGNGVLQLVAETGQPFEVAPGDFETIQMSGINGSEIIGGNEDGRVSTWNDNGTESLALTFVPGSLTTAPDGGTPGFTFTSSGVFTVAVPEPTALVPLLVAGGGLLARRRRKTGAVN